MPPVLAFIPEVLGALGSAIIPEALGAEALGGGLAAGAGEAFAGASAADIAAASGMELAPAAFAPTAAITVNALPAVAGAEAAGAGLGAAGLGAAEAGAAGLGGLGAGEALALGTGLGTAGITAEQLLAGTQVGAPPTGFPPPPGTQLNPIQQLMSRSPTGTFPEPGLPPGASGFASPTAGPGGGLGASGVAAPDVATPAVGPEAGSTEPPFLPSGLRNIEAFGPGEIFPGGSSASNSGLMGWLSAHPGLAATLGIGALGTMLGPQLSKLVNKVPQQQQLTNLQQQEAALAAGQSAYGQQLQSPLVTGQLPAGAEQAVSNAVHDAITTTRARYANLGLSGSTMEQDAIAQINNQATAQRFAIAQQMAQTGSQAIGQAANALGLQDQIFTQLMNAQVAQDTALQSAIARFAAAAALGTGLASRA